MNKHPPRSRGAHHNPANRYHDQQREDIDDGWSPTAPVVAAPDTSANPEHCRSLISYNRSPDVPFDRSINPYRGCEHGCIYCFARPSHAWLDLSPGLDFETRLTYKANAAARLRQELARPGYRPAPIALGINTDAYQPLEKQHRITRQILEVLDACHHPLHIVTKSAIIEDDIPRLADMAARGLAACAVSLTTLDKSLSRRMEPRAAAPARRLKTMERLSAAEIPVTAMIAPVIPVLTDAELETLLSAAREAGARSAVMVSLRLPREVGPLFEDWLQRNFPDKASHVMNRIRDLHGGKCYDSRFGTRMTGSGVFAELIAQRFKLASHRLGYTPPPRLRTDHFTAPTRQPDDKQLSLPF